MEDITYTNTAEQITHSQLDGFFVGWPKHPSSEKFLEILQASHGVEVAIDTETNQVVGFINVISDGIFTGYIPLLEVLPEYQGRGIGKTLIDRVLASYNDLYMLDVCCDKSVEQLYASKGFSKVSGMVRRNYEKQNVS
ncbi:MAG: GNAT family N-acetyltransferase [Phycisphaerae bacterium]|jgi:ribosomal protein S18 acetylase RimI-like enzyme|nr:GNAT family N-acetyltransferase [Phycisphaerae bacterium]